MGPRLFIAVALIIVSSSLPFLFSTRPAYAHFAHFAHYNARGDEIGQYYAYEQLEPEYAPPKEPVGIMFSVQNSNGGDTYNIDTMVEVYSAATGERLQVWPWTKRDIGDFEVFYNFPEIGNYQIVLSVANYGGSLNLNGIDPLRTALSSTTGCNCDRTIFNISISNNFGTIWNTTMLLSFMVPISVVGGVLAWNYRHRIKNAKYYPKGDQNETARYIIMLAAIAGGIVHLGVYAEHASLRLEYSIFLLVAGVVQIGYGVAYTILTLAGQAKNESVQQYYRKRLAVNLFGLIGTGVLLGLYAYSVTFPPPLSPNNKPEDIDIGGILAKAIEAFTVIGILYLMRLEKRQLARQLKHQT
jgi:hypothetical protein